jgi:ribosomal protein S18 acetylase RimI-like enzyme
MSADEARLVIRRFEDTDTSGVVSLAAAEGWPTFSDPRVVRRLFAAAGAIGLVAVREDGRVVGVAHALTDGHHAYLTTLVVAADVRGAGIGTALVDRAIRTTGAVRMDLLSTPEADRFYEALPHSRFSGFRLYPHDAADDR